MTSDHEAFAYDLWLDPWLRLQRPDGSIDRSGIYRALINAHEYASLIDASPLVVAGIQRLLVAILQDALQPRSQREIRGWIGAGTIPVDRLNAFAEQFADRFDLFSFDKPFLQSADLGTAPAKEDTVKSAGYLFYEQPTGTNHTHYRHGLNDAYAICPACAAAGLCTIPAFATTGGAGIKQSINGVPPYYVLPIGETLATTLLQSLLIPPWFPVTSQPDGELPWWRRESHVGKNNEVQAVSYLASLTFPARRMRLHPRQVEAACSRCGEHCTTGVSTMVYDMGEFRAYGLPTWQDAFVAYQPPKPKAKIQQPNAVRPQEGRAVWREFNTLFLSRGPSSTGGSPASGTGPQSPLVVNHLSELYEDDLQADMLTFRVIGVRTDKAKIIEWSDSSFNVPFALMSDPTTGVLVNAALDCVEDCAFVIGHAMLLAEGREHVTRYRRLQQRLLREYWQHLAEPFTHYILLLADRGNRYSVQDQWIDQTIRYASDVFEETIATIGDDARALRIRVQATEHCRVDLFKVRQERSNT